MKTLSSKTVYKNKWMEITEDITEKDNKKRMYAHILTTDSVFIVPVNDKNEIAMINLYRYPIKEISWEVPAGSIDEGETKETAAQRELQEETGYISNKFTYINRHHSYVAFSNEVGYVFLAENLEKTGNNQMTEEGITKLKFFSWEKVFEMIRGGEITDTNTISPLFMIFLYLQNKKKSKLLH